MRDLRRPPFPTRWRRTRGGGGEGFKGKVLVLYAARLSCSAAGRVAASITGPSTIATAAATPSSCTIRFALRYVCMHPLLTVIVAVFVRRHVDEIHHSSRTRVMVLSHRGCHGKSAAAVRVIGGKVAWATHLVRLWRAADPACEVICFVEEGARGARPGCHAGTPEHRQQVPGTLNQLPSQLHLIGARVFPVIGSRERGEGRRRNTSCE